METLGGRLQLCVSGGVGEDPTSHPNLDLSPSLPSPPLPLGISSLRLTHTHLFACPSPNHLQPQCCSRLQSSLLLVHDDTLRRGGQAGVCLCCCYPCQSTEESAQVTQMPSAARWVGRQPPATNSDLQQWAKGPTRAVI